MTNRQAKRIAGVCLIAIALLATAAPAAAKREWVPDVVQPVVQDHEFCPTPDRVHLTGLLGTRIERSEANRLLEVDEDEMLAGFRHRPGEQAWIGEHVGKFLHAASLAWANTGDPKLRQKIDRVAAGLMECQEPDGYLGTYTKDTRFQLARNADWDVWVHKYDLLGLLTYYQVTGNQQALQASRRIGDLLCGTFGPGRKDILSAGTHMGMAATSVLEPMVLLYRCTGDGKYLEFARYVTTAWEEPKGPHIISALTTVKEVNHTANAKAYEMLSNLVGLAELYRYTGDRKYLTPLLNAWTDITERRLYLTGSASQGEHFHGDFDLPNASNNCETCVTVTWIQFNLELLRLTGEAKYANELEKSCYNQLIAAQKPTGDNWCYFTNLEGRKTYRSDTNCCHSSGPRGMALIPTFAYTADPDGPVIQLVESGTADLKLPDDKHVRLEQQTMFPRDGNIKVTLHTDEPAAFSLKLRLPSWLPNAGTYEVNGHPIKPEGAVGGYAAFHRQWKDGDLLTASWTIPFRAIAGTHTNVGKVAFQYGPLVLAADAGLDRGVVRQEQKHAAAGIAIPQSEIQNPRYEQEPMPENRRPWMGGMCYRIQAQDIAGKPVAVHLVPFADAGADGSEYMVWLPVIGK